MFGGPDRSRFSHPTELDGNGDGLITIDDAGFAQLRVWSDLDQDGVTDEGELSTLIKLGIASLGAGRTDLGSQTPQGNTISDSGTYLYPHGRVDLQTL